MGRISTPPVVPISEVFEGNIANYWGEFSTPQRFRFMEEPQEVLLIIERIPPPQRVRLLEDVKGGVINYEVFSHPRTPGGSDF